ncbi:type I restriction-modification system subunit M [Halobacteriota archaeon]
MEINDVGIKQTEINGMAWKACDTFRGVIDPAEYKNYILVMLFLKYLSDIWKDKLANYQERYKGDETRIQRKMKRDRFTLPEKSSFDYIYENRNATNIGELINMVLGNIEEANKKRLEGVFRNIDFNSEANLGQTKDRNRRLKNLIEDFANPKLDLRPSRIGNLDIIGNTYEYLISHFASDAGKKGGEFYTPSEVSTLIAKLVKPKPGDRICDPTVGSGSLLIKVANEVGDTNYSLYGQESNGSTWALCKMNMFLHDIDEARIEWGDTINNPKLIQNDALMKFNVVVANPPFSLDKWGAEDAPSDRFRRFHRGIPPKSKGDYAFITHMVETMVEAGGRVGVVAPHGVLFRGGSEGKIRRRFIKENLIDAVIGLPPALFFGTGIPATILVFKKGRKTTDVLLIDASREFEKYKKQNKLRDQDIEKIIQTYNDYKTIDKYAYRATLEEMEENDFNLNIPRYVDTFEPEEEVNIPAVQEKIVQLEKELTDVRKEMDRYLKELGL